MSVSIAELTLSPVADSAFGAPFSISYPPVMLQRSAPVCILGSNGSGKSALVSFLFGNDTFRCESEAKIKVGSICVSSRPNLSDFGFRLLPQVRPDTGALSCADLWSLLRTQHSGPSTENRSVWAPLSGARAKQIKKLSGGQWKLALLFGYLYSPVVSGIIMDEPLAGLSGERQQALLDEIEKIGNERKLFVLLTSVVGESRPALDRWSCTRICLPNRQ